jgi:hypothetical protein
LKRKEEVLRRMGKLPDVLQIHLKISSPINIYSIISKVKYSKKQKLSA